MIMILVEIVKKVKYLLKDKGMTIQGAKKYFAEEETNLDETANLTLKHEKYFEIKTKQNFKNCKS